MDFMRVHRAVVDTGRLKLHLDSPDLKSQVCCPFTLQASADAGKFGANSVFVVARSAVTIELQPLGSIVCPALLQGVAQVCEDRISTARVLRAQCVLESDGSVVTMDGVHTVPMVPVVRNVVSPDGTWVSSEEATGGATSFCPEAVSPGRGSADRQDFGATPPNFQSRNFGCPNDAHDREVDRALYSFTLGLVQPSPLIDQRQCILVPGVVPFAPGTIELELENPTVNHVVIPRGSVVALVHPVGFADLQKFEPLDPSDFSAADRVGHPHSVTVASATVESVPPTDQADIQLEPRLPPLALDEALPEDLQALADRALAPGSAAPAVVSSRPLEQLAPRPPDLPGPPLLGLAPLASPVLGRPPSVRPPLQAPPLLVPPHPILSQQISVRCLVGVSVPARPCPVPVIDPVPFLPSPFSSGWASPSSHHCDG
ncbi:Intersectin-1 [Frankliniella fusca]|uniref:Intersectin-1 n=1 Tax=Frankliniella fusca TaxID=407009 RepID=A0AAE1LQU4_9NEOP|nr:Intersectin-1 [Frankliniella fusca]